MDFGPFSAQLSLHTADGEDTCVQDHLWKKCQKFRSMLHIHTYVLTFSPSLPRSVPSVPQDVRASSNGFTSVFVTWMGPTVFFREQVHNCSSAIGFSSFAPQECCSRCNGYKAMHSSYIVYCLHV